ncbi:MAG: hypothetical protein IT464_12835 [Planctomycetes bacterium]|nr:hypothetical protein [Planctomycetota bacterium]
MAADQDVPPPVRAAYTIRQPRYQVCCGNCSCRFGVEKLSNGAACPDCKCTVEYKPEDLQAAALRGETVLPR